MAGPIGDNYGGCAELVKRVDDCGNKKWICIDRGIWRVLNQIGFKKNALPLDIALDQAKSVADSGMGALVAAASENRRFGAARDATRKARSPDRAYGKSGRACQSSELNRRSSIH